VQQFAALRAELAAAPEGEHRGIRARYQLDEAHWQWEEAAWRDRLTADPTLLRSYQAHFHYLRALLGPRG